MITKNDECVVDIRNNAKVNMSNWQIAHTLDTLTMVNNKFDVLDKINVLINRGINKSNIFITDKSFLISTNYKTYFDNGYVINNEGTAIIKASNIGKIITMEYNPEISKINVLFEYYKKISSLIAKNHRCRLRSYFLSYAYDALENGDIGGACEVLKNGAIKQVEEIYEKYIRPDYRKMKLLIGRIEEMHKRELPKVIKKNEADAVKCRKNLNTILKNLIDPLLESFILSNEHLRL